VDQATQKEYLEKVVVNQEKMAIWAKHAPMNFQHKYHLVKAEKARVFGQITEAMDLYEKAILGVRDNGYIQEEALAYELAAEFYLARGMEKIAQTYMKEAYYHYQQWGALAKVEDLEERYPQFLTIETARVIPTDTTILGTRIKVSLNQGDVVILYTDGITEAFNPEREEYGIDRLCEVVKQHWQQTANEIKQAVIDDVKQYISTQKVFDDIALLVLKQK
jgi:serine/threonine protein phosphatase PrpC